MLERCSSLLLSLRQSPGLMALRPVLLLQSITCTAARIRRRFVLALSYGRSVLHGSSVNDNVIRQGRTFFSTARAYSCYAANTCRLLRCPARIPPTTDQPELGLASALCWRRRRCSHAAEVARWGRRWAVEVGTVLFGGHVQLLRYLYCHVPYGFSGCLQGHRAQESGAC